MTRAQMLRAASRAAAQARVVEAARGLVAVLDTWDSITTASAETNALHAALADLDKETGR